MRCDGWRGSRPEWQRDPGQEVAHGNRTLRPSHFEQNDRQPTNRKVPIAGVCCARKMRLFLVLLLAAGRRALAVPSAESAAFEVIASPGAGTAVVVALAPLPNCTKKMHLCYQGPPAAVGLIRAGDPLACKPPQARLVTTCAAAGQRPLQLQRSPDADRCIPVQLALVYGRV